MQSRLGLTAPFYGPIFAHTVWPSPATVTSAHVRRVRGVEAEFAFELARAIAPRAAPYSEAEVLAHVEKVRVTRRVQLAFLPPSPSPVARRGRR
ncbi:hypothetical protein EON67_11625, partial [archaeon]